MNLPGPLAELESQLRSLSHSEEAVQKVRDFARGIGKTAKRQAAFSPEGALVRRPITYQEALETGKIAPEEDRFTFLQGDIVRTDAAYFMGEQVRNLPTFVVLNSTCDLVEERRTYAALLRVKPLLETDPQWKEKLGQLLKFESTREMYLPPLPGDAETTVANIIDFDGIAQIRLADLRLAIRGASLSLVGWRVYGAMVRNVMVRAGKSEVALRTGFEGPRPIIASHPGP